MTTPYAIEVKAYQGGTTDVPHSPPLVTEAEYWETYYTYPDKVYEWHDGELEEKAVSEHITYLTHVWFSELLNHYFRTKQIAKPAGLEMGFRLILPQSLSIRRPDLGIVLNTNPVPLLPYDSSYDGIFDICIEAISKSRATEITRDTVIKKAEYAQVGVKEYLILDGNQTHTAFYYLSAKGIYLPIKPVKGEVIKSKVLPGFQFRIADLYDKPSPDDMIDDPVYQGFVLPGYVKAKKRAVKAEEQAQKAEEQSQKDRLAKQKAEEQAEKAKEQAQKELVAKQKAEEQAQKELVAKQKAEEQADKATEQSQKDRLARQKAEQKVDKAEEKAQKELVARQQAEQQTKRLAEKLQQLGIKLDEI